MQGYDLGVVVIEARGLRGIVDNKQSNPKARVWVNEDDANVKATPTRPGSLHPVFADPEQLDAWRFQTRPGERMNLQVMHISEQTQTEQEVGFAEVLPPQEHSNWEERWVPLREPRESGSGNQRQSGPGKVRVLIASLPPDSSMPELPRFSIEPVWLMVSVSRADVKVIGATQLEGKIVARGPGEVEEAPLGILSHLAQGTTNYFRESSPYSPPAFNLRRVNYVKVSLTDGNGNESSTRTRVPFLGWLEKQDQNNGESQKVIERPFHFDNPSLISGSVNPPFCLCFPCFACD